MGKDYLRGGLMIKIAICDDEKSARDEIKDLISELYNEDDGADISLFSSASELLNSEYSKYDIVFLDIEINEDNGVDVANTLRENGLKTVIFFITSHASYITSAMKSGPFQYMLKPIKKQLFKEEFERAIRHLSALKNELQVVFNGEIIIIEMNKIAYIETINRKTVLHLMDETCILASHKLDHYDKLLQCMYFTRVHKSFLVNLFNVRSIKGEDIVLKNNIELKASKSYQKQAKAAFLKYVSEVAL